MNATPKTKLLRGLAAATLFVWLIAQFVCTIHCTSGKVSLASVSAAKGCCHKSDASHKDSSKACPSLKLLAAKQTATQDLAAPEQLHIVATFLLAEISSLLSFEKPSLDHPTWRPERVIAHELSLGSDARSHAPPSLG
jgi:hypothetical protein